MFLSHSDFNRDVDNLKVFIERNISINKLLFKNLKIISEMEITDEIGSIFHQFILNHQAIKKREYDYVMIIITLYGFMEKYTETLLHEYLTKLSHLYRSYKDLPKDILNNHINLSVDLIKKLDYPKYAGVISKEELIRNLYLCIEEDKCKLNNLAFSQHTANFRIDEISNVFLKSGIRDFIITIKNNTIFKEFYMNKRNVNESEFLSMRDTTIFEKINDLANRRNEIAHGNISNIMSYDILSEYVEFVEVFINTMYNEVTKRILKFYIDENIAKEIKPIAIYRNEIICFKLVANERISKNDIIIGFVDDKISFSRIKNIRINDKDFEEFEASHSECDIGVQVDFKAKDNKKYRLLHSF